MKKNKPEIAKIKKWRYTTNNNTVILFCISGLVTDVIAGKKQKLLYKRYKGWNIYSVIKFILSNYKNVQVARLKGGYWKKMNKQKLNKIVTLNK